MFKKTKLIAILFIFFNFFISTASFAYDRFAKVVFLGYFGSGKTTLYNLLTNKRVGMNTDHTAQIDTSLLGMDVKGTEVGVYLNDTSAAPRHQECIEQFCKNAHLIFILLDASDLAQALDEESKEESEEKHENYRLSNHKDYFEKLLCNIPRIAPKSKVILVATGNDSTNFYIKFGARGFFVKDHFDWYIKNWKSKFSDKFIVATYDLTLKDTTGEEAIKHKNNLYEIIVKSLVNYGIESLPKEPKGFLGKIFEEKVYLSKYGQKELSNVNYSLICPDDKLWPKTSKETIIEKVEKSDCEIF